MAIEARAVPLFFESRERPLYGVYHPSSGARLDAPVVVQCHTLGVEHLTSYRAEVQLARAAAKLGFPAFRYHSRGHGDSAGDFAAVTFGGLVEDALAAASEARRRSGATRIVWVGVRFGALIASAAMRRDRHSIGLALWEPVEKADAYFRAMLRNVLFSQVVHGRRPSSTVNHLLETLEREGSVDVHGYFLHRALHESARQLELSTILEGWHGPTFLAQIQERSGLSPMHAALIGELEARGAHVTPALVHDEPGWHFIANPAWENRDLIDRTSEWLNALA